MRLGVVFPQTEIGNDPIVIRDYVQTVEGAGFEHLIAYDHVLGAARERFEGVDVGYRDGPPYTEQHPFHEVFVLFGYLAGLTNRLELMTGVLILPQRQTALVAKQAAAVDLLSGGRLRLGVGIGWNYVEYESLNESFRTRGRRVEEQVRLLRQLWTEPLVSFKGEWHQVDRAGLNPLPVQRPIPIWMGGRAEVVLKRTARLADGWFMPGESNPPAETRALFDRLLGHLEEAGRDLSSFALETRMRVTIGGPADWARRAKEWRGLGVTHLSANTMKAGFESPQQHLDAVLRWKRAVEGS
jgi:probable F420-dependent oxidoreductase